MRQKLTTKIGCFYTGNGNTGTIYIVCDVEIEISKAIKLNYEGNNVVSGEITHVPVYDMKERFHEFK